MDSTLHYQRILFFTALLLALSGLTGCASVSSSAQRSANVPVTNATTPARTQSRPQLQSRSHRGLAIARDMVGTPYLYGGANPRGFDCSGLVYYSYRKASVKVPRTTTEQFRQSKRVKMSRLRPGDLIFFRLSQRKLSHVGIYAGNGKFIHSPSSGKRVSYGSLDNPYWKARVIGAGRFQ